MSEYIESTTIHKGYTVKIIADQDAQPPDEFGDEGRFIVTTRNRYFERLHNGKDAAEVMEDKDFTKKYWIFPLYMYAHSGVALNLGRGGQFSDPWDSGQVGFVFCAKSERRYRVRDFKKSWSALRSAESYIEEWNQYLSGDVWGYVIEDADGNYVDSCWGFYGLEYCRSEALSYVPTEVSCPTDVQEVEETLA